MNERIITAGDIRARSLQLKPRKRHDMKNMIVIAHPSSETDLYKGDHFERCAYYSKTGLARIKV